jgi:hypothetical protein
VEWCSPARSGVNTVTLADSLSVITAILGPTAVILILVSRYQQGKSILSVPGGVLVVALVGLNGLNGQRHSALGIMLSILIFMTRKRGSKLRTLLGLSAILAFAYIVVLYRVTVTSGSRPESIDSALLQDLGSVTFTTGVTATLMGEGPYLNGASIIAGLIRQLPGPLSNLLFGPPDGTGAFQFRRLSGLASDGNGFGFSIPAEGVLNFGMAGAFVVPFVAGVLMAWIYARFSLVGSRAIHVLYVVAASTLPFAFRSDTLGAVKGVLYPGVILACAFGIAAAARRAHARRARAVPVPLSGGRHRTTARNQLRLVPAMPTVNPGRRPQR